MAYEEFTRAQEERIDAVYEMTLEYCRKLTCCSWMTDGDTEAGEEPFVLDIADAAAEILTKHGWKVYFPTRTATAGGTVITDAYPKE